MRLRQENNREKCFGSARGVASMFGVPVTQKKNDDKDAREARILLYQSRASQPGICIFTGEKRNAFQEENQD